jgi:transposase
MSTLADRLPPDGLWRCIQPLLPPHPPTPVAARPAPWVTGPAWPRSCSWLAPHPVGVAAGGRVRLRQRDRLLATLQRVGRRWGVRAAPGAAAGRARAGGALDWSRISVDSFSLRATGDHTGANPVDRAKHGSKLHLAVDGGGLPLTLLVTAANTNHSTMFEALLDASRRCARQPTSGAAALRRSTPTRCTTTAAAAARGVPEVDCGGDQQVLFDDRVTTRRRLLAFVGGGWCGLVVRLLGTAPQPRAGPALLSVGEAKESRSSCGGVPLLVEAGGGACQPF